MEENRVFEGIPSGDYEESCFAVTPKMYELVTGCKPKLMKDLYREWGIEGEPKDTYLDENHLYKGHLNLYLYEIEACHLFDEVLPEIIEALYSNKKRKTYVKINNKRRDALYKTITNRNKDIYTKLED